ncbi:hypothetical protein E4T50_06148 [Aureobasidium sp. EXF-12298]|nr:hypothetical protein E4T50_06148 [Aureobasidium sp. EXF-12298]KAI4777922.1 hypothetical protein E4T52_07135 [Aureobasidium sp. EXF-3400]
MTLFAKVLGLLPHRASLKIGKRHLNVVPATGRLRVLNIYKGTSEHVNILLALTVGIYTLTTEAP